ncbi:MAG: YhjD/YihY/BrkB family envelope integrity protein [Holophaga sp.]|nr:YhjD/YihY/BrkB family envelope integrity protein [Holophaga sp.]
MASPAQERDQGPVELVRRGWGTLQEAAAGFSRNSDLRQASSLAFYSTLALIPALLLLTFLLSVAIGSSQAATQKTSEFIRQVIPRFGEVVLREVGSLASHPRAAGTLNLLVLTWSLTPLVSCLREVINTMFKQRNRRTLLASKAMDLATGMAFIVGLAGMAGAGVALKYLARFSWDIRPPVSLNFSLPFGLTVLLVWAVYFAFTPQVRNRHRLAGALTTAVLWFLLRPAFTLFLTHDPGYGFAFGSFKSIFIVVIWIYYSMAALLFGAEVVASLHRGERLPIHRLMARQGGVPFQGDTRLLLEAPTGWVFFQQGDPGTEMFFVLSGLVSIRQDGHQVAQVRKGNCFGEMTFLLGLEREATAVAMEPCRCVIIHNHNFEALLLEFPGIVREMLVEMASRLSEEKVH